MLPKKSSQYIVDVVKKSANNNSDNIIPNDLDIIINKVKYLAAQQADNKLSFNKKNKIHNSNSNNLYKVKNNTAIDTGKLRYHLNELIHFCGEDFIKVAYLVILKRNPDAGGFNYYLDKLQSAKWSKENILFRLLHSKEGKLHKVVINHLIPSLLLRTCYCIPVIGYFMNVIIALVRLPRLAKSVTNVQEYVTELNIQQQFHLNKLSEQLDLKFHEIGDIESVLADSLDKKADKNSLVVLADSLDKKADKTQIESLNKLIKIKSDVVFVDDAAYEEFESLFRGNYKEITNRMKVYLDLIPKVKNGLALTALDLGCGRGEWLRLITSQGYSITGVDMRLDAVTHCNDNGLSAIKSEALTYLLNEPDKSLSLITGFHIIEHIQFNHLLKVFKECFRALKADGVVIFETPNLKNILVGSGDFYLDPTHRIPLHPLTMQFFLKKAGFKSVEIQYVGEKLINHNDVVFNDLNDYVNIPRDYALVCKKL